MRKLHKVHKSFEDDALWGLGKFTPPISAFPTNPAAPFLAYYGRLKLPPNWFKRLRNSIWMIMDRPRSSQLAKVWVFVDMILTAVAVFTLCAESSTVFWDNVCDTNSTNCQNTTTYTYYSSGYYHHLHAGVFTAEFLTNTIFTLEWVLSVMTCPSLRIYLTRFICWTDLLSVITSWIMISIYLGATPDFADDMVAVNLIYVGRSLRTVRVLRFFRLMRGWETLTLALQASLWEIGIICVFFFTGTLVFSVLIFYAEYSNPDTFKNIPIGFWWSIVTMTTVGYGDMYPTTFFGYLVGTACAIAGMFATAVPIPIISENFSSFRLIFQLLGEYETRKTLQIDPAEDGKTVFKCPVCHTRSFMYKSVSFEENGRPTSVIGPVIEEVPDQPEVNSSVIGWFRGQYRPNHNVIQPDLMSGTMFKCKVCHTRAFMKKEHSTSKSKL